MARRTDLNRCFSLFSSLLLLILIAQDQMTINIIGDDSTNLLTSQPSLSSSSSINIHSDSSLSLQAKYEQEAAT